MQFCLLLSVAQSQVFPLSEISAHLLAHRKIRLIESNAKCRYLKKLTLQQVFYPSEAPSPPMTTYSPPPYTPYTCIAYLFTLGTGEEWIANERKG